MPLRYVEFHDIKVFQKIYVSKKSRSRKSSAVLAVWPSPSGIITSRTPCGDDVRVGEIIYFLLHCIKVKLQVSTDPEIVDKTHILACIRWYEDHSRKFLLGNGIVIASSTCTAFSSASFMPVSRILSQCAIVHRNMHMDYGEDSIQIALPLKRHSIVVNV